VGVACLKRRCGLRNPLLREVLEPRLAHVYLDALRLVAPMRGAGGRVAVAAGAGGREASRWVGARVRMASCACVGCAMAVV
jgi:hypothetical protein